MDVLETLLWLSASLRILYDDDGAVAKHEKGKKKKAIDNNLDFITVQTCRNRFYAAASFHCFHPRFFEIIPIINFRMCDKKKKDFLARIMIILIIIIIIIMNIDSRHFNHCWHYPLLCNVYRYLPILPLWQLCLFVAYIKILII